MLLQYATRKSLVIYDVIPHDSSFPDWQLGAIFSKEGLLPEVYPLGNVMTTYHPGQPVWLHDTVMQPNQNDGRKALPSF